MFTGDEHDEDEDEVVTAQTALIGFVLSPTNTQFIRELTWQRKRKVSDRGIRS